MILNPVHSSLGACVSVARLDPPMGFAGCGIDGVRRGESIECAINIVTQITIGKAQNSARRLV